MSQLIGYTNFNNRGNIYDIIVEGPTGSTGGITGATGISDDINLSNVDNLNGKVNVYGIQKTSSATAPRAVVGDGTTGHNFQYKDPYTEIDIDNHVISSTQDNGTYATSITVENLPYPTIDLSTKDYDLDLETHVISKGGQAAIQYTTIGSGLIHSWEILNGEHFAREMDQGTYNHILYFNNTPGVDNGHIKHGPPVTTSVALIGNPIHQFVTGGDGNLDFRGMYSPNNTIAFNPTATNIEMEVNIPTGPTPDAFENGVFQAALNPGINFTNLDCSPSAFGASVTQTINAVPINYQVTDTNISNNTISRINDAGSTSVVDCTNTEVSITAPIVKVNALPNRNSPDQYVSRISSTGQLYNSSVPYSRRATITDVVVPIGTADGIVYASLIYTPTGIYGRVGDIIEFTFSSIAGFDDVGSETDLFIGGHLIPSIGGGVNLLKGTVCLTSLVGPTYKYTVTYNNTTTGTTRLYTGSFVGPAILSGLGVNLRTASFPATTVAITIDFGFLQLNRLNQAT